MSAAARGRAPRRPRRARAAALAALAAAAALTSAPRPAAADLEPRVLILPAEGAPPTTMPKLAAEIADALARGAAKTTHQVSRAESTLSDTAVIVGCDPAQRACLDAVAAALNVDQVVSARVRADHGDAVVDVTAVTRETEPTTRTFTIHAQSRAADVAALEPAVVEMLASGEARREAQVHKEPAPPALPPATTTPAATTGAATTATAAPSAHPRWPVAVTIVGGVLVVAGASAWLGAAAKQDQIDSAPTATAADLDHLAALEGTAKDYAAAGNLLVVGGAIVATAGAALWWSTWRRGDVTVAPVIGEDRAALVVGGAW